MKIPSFWSRAIEGIPSDQQIFHEFRILQKFVDHCDSVGIALPGDSRTFRKTHLDLNTPSAFDSYIIQPSGWPNPDLYELMAIAQHHGLPTRLLDWSKRSYVAAYFAASGALQALGNDKTDKMLAVWVLNIERKNLYSKLDVVQVPSGQNRNISSQAGCFTVLRQIASRGEPFEGTHLLDEYLEQYPDTPLIKVTVPVTEAAEILNFCRKYGVTGATIYPDLYGAAKAAMDDMNQWKYRTA